MVTIRKKYAGSTTYYYLAQSLRKNGKIEKRERYLGKRIPKNIEDIKREFLTEMHKERWYPALQRIKNGFLMNLKEMPSSAKTQELEKFAIRFTYDTQRIEGSTLTLRETARLLEEHVTPSGKPLKDVKEAEAHKSLFEDVLKTEDDLYLDLVLYWHKTLLQTTRPDIAGKIRSHQVVIAGSKFMPPFPAEVYPLLREFFKWYERNKKKLHPVELAACVHLKFVTIHPFADGNGRISRLMMNFVLHKKSYPMFNIPYEGRNSYYRALERAQIKKTENIFVQWFFKKYIQENRRYAT